MATTLFLDCEFTGLVKDAELISLCLYADEANYFYAEFNDYDSKILSDWHIENVISRLSYAHSTDIMEVTGPVTRMKGSRAQVIEHLKSWISRLSSIEIWGDVPAYDWVLFCDLFGGALQLPDNIYYIQFDLATMARLKHITPDFSRFEMAGMDTDRQHNALEDCRAEKACWEKIKAMASNG